MSDRYSQWPTRLALAPDAFVAPGASLVGEITLGPRSSVWFGVAMRGDCAPITVGEESNLQDLTVVHVDEDAPCRIGARVTIGHRAIIHGCTIEDDCLIGMGAIVLSRATIGAGSLIGAGALIKEGQTIPPGSLAVGAPARVIGPVTEAHRAAIARGAAHYVTFSRGYLARGVASQFPLRPTVHQPQALVPMTYFEWEQRLAVLAGSPEWVRARFAGGTPEQLRARTRPDAWCALEVAGHLADADRDLFGPWVARALAEDLPVVSAPALQPQVAARAHRDAEPSALIAAWRTAREALIATLDPLGPPAWARMLVHPRRGPIAVGDVVRHWSEHDLSHRRQIARALAAAS